MFQERYGGSDFDGCDDHDGIDNGEGFLVCQLCGRVLDQFLSGPQNDYGAPSVQQTSWSVVECALIDICENNHLGKEVALQSVSMYQRVRPSFPGKWKNGEVTAYCLFGACIELEMPFTPTEIERMCDVTAGAVCRIAKRCKPLRWVPNVEYTSRYCSLLDLSFEHVRRISQTVSSCKNLSGCRPQTINAAAIYNYCQDKRLDKSLKEIAMACAVSEASVKKLGEKMRQNDSHPRTFFYEDCADDYD